MTKKTPSGLSNNPHGFWKNPFQWFRWRRIQLLHRDYAATRIELNEFEMRVLVPELLSRIEFMGELFTEMQRICTDPETNDYLVPALRTILQSAAGAPSPEDIATNYLKGVAEIIENSFLVRLRRIALGYQSIDDIPTLLRFLNEVHLLSGSITSTESVLFRYRVVGRPYVVEKVSGKVIADEPKEMEIVLTPFRIALDQLRKTAETTEKSIEHWKQQADAAKKPFLEFLAASTNAATSRRTILIQTLAIILSLSFSTFFLSARDPFALSRLNAALKIELQELREQAGRQASEIEQLKNELRAAQQSKPVIPSNTP